MNEKQSITLNGSLISPLIEGMSAIIFHDSMFTLTAHVMAIHSIRNDEVRFETDDAFYIVRLHPIPKSPISTARYRFAA